MSPFLLAEDFNGNKARQGRPSSTIEGFQGAFCRSPWQGKSGHSPQKETPCSTQQRKIGQPPDCSHSLHFRRFPGSPGKNRPAFFRQPAQRSPQGVIMRKSICLSIILQSQPFADIHNKILHVGHNGFDAQAAPVSQLVYRKFRDIHAVKVYGADGAVCQHTIRRRHVAGGNGMKRGGHADDGGGFLTHSRMAFCPS